MAGSRSADRRTPNRSTRGFRSERSIGGAKTGKTRAARAGRRSHASPAEELPEDLRRLSGRQAEELRYKTFPEDSAKLMASIQKKFRHPWLSKWRSVARPVYGTAVVFFAAVVAYSMGSGWWGSASSDNPFFSAALQRERTQALSDEVQNKVIGVVTETDLKTPIQGAVVTVTRKGKIPADDDRGGRQL